MKYINLILLIFGAFLTSGCTTMSWTRQSMIGVYEFPAADCPTKSNYPNKMSSTDFSLTRHGRQVRCENSKTYKFTISENKASESAIVSLHPGPSCKLTVALILGREDSDVAYAKSRLDAGKAHAVQLAQFFSSEQKLTLTSSEPRAFIVNAVIDKNPRGPICRNFK